MRVFKNAWFERFAHKQCIPDKALLEAIERAEKGQIDADLGGGVIKQRVARKGLEAFAPSFCITQQDVPSSCTALPKASATILMMTKKRNSRRQRPMSLD